MAKVSQFNDSPLVTVELITYNHEKYIAQAIESIVGQKTSFLFKLLICEDCSSDNTAVICREYKSKYPTTIDLYSNPRNLGMISNAEKLHGLSFSTKSKYIAMCDGDDYWTDFNKLQKQVDFLEANLDFAFSFHNLYNLQNECFELMYPYGLPKSQFTLEDFVHTFYARTLSIVYRKSALNLSLLKNIPFGDWAMSILVLQSGKAKYFNEPMGVYRKHIAGAYSGTEMSKRVISAFETMYLLSSRVDAKYKSLIQAKLAYLSTSYIRVGLSQFNWRILAKGFYVFLKSPWSFKTNFLKFLITRRVSTSTIESN